MRRLKVLPIAIASIDENILVTVEAFPCPHDNASWFIVAGAIADEPRSITRCALYRLPRAHFHNLQRGLSSGRIGPSLMARCDSVRAGLGIQ